MEAKHLQILTWVAVAMLLAAVLRLPYGYYQLLRIVVCLVGAGVAYWTYQRGRVAVSAVAATAAVVFNPVAPLHLDRGTWTLLNVGFAAVLAVIAWRIPRMAEVR